MNSLNLCAKYNNLKRRQQVLEMAPPVERDHGSISWVLKRRIALLDEAIASPRTQKWAVEEWREMKRNRTIKGAK